MEKIGKIFARNLKELRANRHQIDVATDIGVSVRAWQRMEKGGRLPKSPDTITAIAAYFRVPESRLFQDKALPKEIAISSPQQALEVLAKAINQPKAVEKPVIEIPPDQVPLVREFLDAMKDHYAAENLKLALENHKSAQDAVKRAKRHYSDDDGSSSSTG